MTTNFRGTINTTPIKRVPKLWQADHLLGAYHSGDKTYSSKLTLWVPTPRTGEHLPGVFLRLANPVGTSYTRLTPSEFSDLYTFLRSSLSDAEEALHQAKNLIEIYRSAERTLLENSPHYNSTASKNTYQPID